MSSRAFSPTHRASPWLVREPSINAPPPPTPGCILIPTANLPHRHPPFHQYMEVGKGKHGLVKYRCFRTSSALEGYHQHFVAAQDCRAKSVGPRFANASSRQFNFAWNVRGESWFRSISRSNYRGPTRPFYTTELTSSPPSPRHLASGDQGEADASD